MLLIKKLNMTFLTDSARADQVLLDTAIPLILYNMVSFCVALLLQPW